MTGQDLAVSGLLEIKNVEGLRRICNDLGPLLGALCEGALSKEGADSAKRSDIRARSQKLEKFSTGGQGGLVHGFSFFLYSPNGMNAG